MRIGILGSGEVAQALGGGLLKKGHDVRLSSRNPKKLAEWVNKNGPHASAGTFAEAAAHGELVFVCTLGAATEQVLDAVGPASLGGKVVVDVTNALDVSKGGPPSLFVGTTDSLAERIQRKLPKSHVVKAWNTVPNSLMVDPRIPAAHLPICGDDAAAKKRVEALAKELGWSKALDLGDLQGARWMEAMVMLWLRASFAQNTWMHTWQDVVAGNAIPMK